MIDLDDLERKANSTILELLSLARLAQRLQPRPATEPPDDERSVLFYLPLSGWSLGRYDAKRQLWIDVETDRQNEYHEWAPGEVVAWCELPGEPDLAL